MKVLADIENINLLMPPHMKLQSAMKVSGLNSNQNSYHFTDNENKKFVLIWRQWLIYDAGSI